MLTELSLADYQRFWQKVEKQQDGCWPWVGAVNGNGTPVFHVNRKALSANRTAYFIAHHTDPGTKRVLHTCGNQRCVNPAHFTLGAAGNQKLNPEQVWEIRRRYDPAPGGAGNRYIRYPNSASDLAKEFGVSTRTIYRVVYGDSWADLS